MKQEENKGGGLANPLRNMNAVKKESSLIGITRVGSQGVGYVERRIVLENTEQKKDME